jgi:hypothetical protein
MDTEMFSLLQKFKALYINIESLLHITEQHLFKKENNLAVVLPQKNLAITQLITKNIDEKYAFAKYGNIEVVIMKSNGYINASKLCTLGGKRFVNWIRLENAQELIKEVENEINTEVSDLRLRLSPVISIKGGNDQSLTGSYVHPDLVVHVASWLSPKFAIMVSKIVNNYIISEFERKKMIELGEKDNIIEEMNKKLDFMINQNDDLKKINSDQTEKINTLLNHTTVINHKLDYAKTGFVLPSRETDDNVFIIFSNFGNYVHTKNDKISLEKGFSYSALRLMKKSINSRLAQHFKKYPFAVELLTVTNPYANNMWNRLKTELVNRGNITANYIDFNLENGYTEEQLINFIKICNERRFAI